VRQYGGALWWWCCRRLRDKTNGCYRGSSPPSPRPGDDAAAPVDCLSTPGTHRRAPGSSPARSAAARRNYVKKPLNAFMIFMKEMRQRVIDECTLKESAAINQILGRKV